MANAKNVLFIMFDQLRWDYLSCYGHPHLKTPNIDRLASMGVRFDRTYIQSPLCGPSRMSTYTGRYASSHGASWNNVPLKVGELTLGDHLRDSGMDCWLVGKTHMAADVAGMERLGIDPDSQIGKRVAECGFDIFERDDGMRPEGSSGLYDEAGALRYNEYLRSKGYAGENPWHDYANSSIDDDGNVLSGWFLDNADKPANIREEDSETPYMMRRGMDFIKAQGDTPWCCHLSLIKPHWPYIAPEPYASMYGRQDFLPANRTQKQYDTAHPVLRNMMDSQIGKSFANNELRDKVLTAYMGLVKQIDDQIGVLLDWLEETNRLQETMIILTSDHGDFLGDHWLGEKTFFQDCSTKVPLIIFDPSPDADKTRGTTCDHLVELIDIAPTIVDVAGGNSASLDHVLEGKSLLPFLRGMTKDPLRDFVICEYDLAGTGLAKALGANVKDARMFMVADKEWKLIHFAMGHRPMLFDLVGDPDELVDLGASPDHQSKVDLMYEKLNAWTRRPSARTTISSEALTASRSSGSATTGVLIGVRNADDAPFADVAKYVGQKAEDFRT
jgi:arylsulfatase A-like enzyme